MRKAFITLITILAAATFAAAQTNIDGVVELDKTTHDFGDIQLSQGPVSCTFTVKNISSKPIAIYSVVSSCGCTNVTWTKEPISPGKTGTISATYDNKEGAYPFEKNLTAFISGLSQRVVLRLKGEVHSKKLPLGEMYGVHMGALGLKEKEIKAGNIQQGQQKSGEINIANISNSAIKISFADVSEGLKVNAPATLGAGAVGKLAFTVTADRSRWGKNYYYATPVVNGQKQTPVTFWAFTKENFSDWTKEQKDAGASPAFKTSTFSFNPMKAGPKVQASWELTNEGKSDLVIYKIDSDSPAVKVSPVNGKIAPKGKCTVSATLDTAGMEKGEVLVILTLTTNSPLRPIVNLYITGFIN